MKSLFFRIPYQTDWGQSLWVTFSLDNGTPDCLPLQTADGREWTGMVEIPEETRTLRHAYYVADNEGRPVRIEPGTWRTTSCAGNQGLCLDDSWTERPLGQWLHSSAFSRCIMQRYSHLPATSEPSASVNIVLHAAPLPLGWEWRVCGSCRALGEWNPTRAARPRRTGTYEWSLSLRAEDCPEDTTYKYIVCKADDADCVLWEEGGNRPISSRAWPHKFKAVRTDRVPLVPNAPLWRGAGCVVPVFSLRSEGSFGIGDFGDLALFVRWAAATSLSAVQILPVNDTTRHGSWRDSYPYSAISVFALHPVYLDAREWADSQAYSKYEAQGKALNALPEVDYEGVFRLKMDFARALYREIRERMEADDDFKAYCEQQAYWLPIYGRFCSCRDHYGTANFREWPQQGTDSQTAFLEGETAAETGRFYTFLQYLLHRQLARVHREARQAGVILKGDIPIGVSPDSVPAWADGRLFHFNGQAGAPPDDFARRGQNWGFPTYNWEEMAKDGYAWWLRRLRHMRQYFDAYRIDHVLGFFRIWEIPSDQRDGLLGHFRPALPLSNEEIRQYGFTAQPARFAVPVLTERDWQNLNRQFGNKEIARFFENGENGHALRKEWRSQRRIEREIADAHLRDALLNAVTEVLFVEDADAPGLFHPCVAAQGTQRFKSLPAEDQAAFNRLHEDFFYHRHNACWAEEALKKLPAVTGNRDSAASALPSSCIEEESMLACAEDLGMVPASVKGVLERLQILSLEIERMPKAWGTRFAHPEGNPYLSVATIATHDMPPLRLWWHQDRARTQAYWSEALRLPGDAPTEATPEVCERVVDRHLQSPSMLCLIGLQDLLAISASLRSPHPEREQINDPSNSEQYWRYRMHLTIEKLAAATDFGEKLRALVLKSRPPF